MKISLIATHSFPIPSPTHTGDIVIADLARSLDEMGHEVHLYAPAGTYCPPHGKQLPMRASFGKYPPSSEFCEEECFNNHAALLKQADIVHDFSVTKRITEKLHQEGHTNLIQTIMGGAWTQQTPPHNLIVWSESHRNRVLRGATDYEGTPTPDLAGPPQKPVKEAQIVHGGIDTDFYSPTYDKKNFFLWMNRWHPAKGYKQAIELARLTGIELVMSGEHPDNEMFEYQKQCALEAIELAKGLPNVRFQFLPKDPDHHTAKRDLYRQAKALIYSVQFHEPFGLSQAETLACGTPVLGTNYGSVPEVITDGLTGIVRPNDLKSLSDAVKLIDNIDPKTCRSEAIKRFDRKVMAASYLAKYRAILNGKGWV